MVRMLAFIPLATPVCSAGTAAMTTPARLANTRPEPIPWAVVATYSCQVASWKSAIEAKVSPMTRVPVTITLRAPTRLIRGAVQNPIRNEANAEGASSRPDSEIEAPKP